MLGLSVNQRIALISNVMKNFELCKKILWDVRNHLRAFRIFLLLFVRMPVCNLYIKFFDFLIGNFIRYNCHIINNLGY